MIIEIPNYISAETVSYIKETLNPFVDNAPSYTPTNNREGISLAVSKTPELRELDAKLFTIFSGIQQHIVQPRYRPSYLSKDSGYEYHKYSPGDVCLYHSDGEVEATNDPSKSNLRYASVILHLSTNEDGGDLIFPNQNKKIKTEAGKLVVFPPYGMFGHYTTPSETPREIMMTWFHYAKIAITEG